VSEADSSARVVVYTRPGCHLCAEAMAIVTAVAAEEGADVLEVDISGDPGLTERYGEEVPVTTVDGRPHAVWRVDADRLRDALRAGPGARVRWWRRSRPTA